MVGPLAQPPHLGLDRPALHPDVGEDRDRPLELPHRLVVASQAVQHLGELVSQGRLAVPVPDGDAHSEGLDEQAMGAIEVPGQPPDASQPVEGRHLRGGIAEPNRPIAARGEVVPRRLEVPPAGRQETRHRSGVRERGIVAGLIGQGDGLDGQPGRGFRVTPSVRSDGEIRGEPCSIDERPVTTQGTERLVVVLLGRRPLAAPLVHPAELPLDAGDVVPTGSSGRPLEAGDGVGEPAVQRVQVADRLVEVRHRRVPQGERRLVVRTGIGVGEHGSCVVAGPAEVLRGEVVAARLALVVRHRRRDRRTVRRWPRCGEQRIGNAVVEEPAPRERRLVVDAAAGPGRG